MEPIEFYNNGKIKLPQPAAIPESDRDIAMGAYLMMFAGWAIGMPLPFFNFFASWIYYFVNRNRSRFVHFHAYQSMLAQFFIALVNFFLLLLLIIMVQLQFKGYQIFLFFFAAGLIINILFIIISIKACIRGKAGRFYYMFIFGLIAFNKFYSEKAQAKEKKRKVIINEPPKNHGEGE